MSIKWGHMDVGGQRQYFAEAPGVGVYTVDRDGPRARWELWFLPEGGEPKDLKMLSEAWSYKDSKERAEKHASGYTPNSSDDDIPIANPKPRFNWYHVDSDGTRSYYVELSGGSGYSVTREGPWWEVNYLSHAGELETVTRYAETATQGREMAEQHARGEFRLMQPRSTRKKAPLGYLPNPNASDEIPIANPDDANWNDNLYELWFGAVGTQKLYVWASSFDSAWETAVEWLDDKGKCGYFTFLGENELREAADDLGIRWPGIKAFSGSIGSRAEKILERAEADLTVIGHTTLECEKKMKGSAYIASHEWGGRDVTRRDEYDEVRRRSLSKSVKISYAAYNVFQQYWHGQGDALYAVLSRRGNSVDWVTVDAMPDEIERLEETAEEITDNEDSTPGEVRTAEAMLKQLSYD